MNNDIHNRFNIIICQLQLKSIKIKLFLIQNKTKVNYDQNKKVFKIIIQETIKNEYIL